MRLELRASVALTLLTAATHAAAAAVLWGFLPSPGGAGSAILVSVLGALAIRDRTLLWGKEAPACLELRRDGAVLVGLRNGTEFEGQVVARRYVSRWVVVLGLASARWGQRTILVARDMLAAGEFRHLRLWALWNALPATRLAHDA